MKNIKILHFFFIFSAKDNFTFKCHRSNGTNTSAPQDIYAVSTEHISIG